MGGLVGGSPSPPTIKMPPQPAPPAMRDDPELAQAELEMQTEVETAKEKRAKYRKKTPGKAKSVSHKQYKGGGLNT